MVAWLNAHAPWARTAVDLVAPVEASAVAIARLWQLGDFDLGRAMIAALAEVATTIVRSDLKRIWARKAQPDSPSAR